MTRIARIIFLFYFFVSSMRLAFLIIFAILFIKTPKAQNLSAFSDYRDYFYIFDNGVSQQMEYQPVQSYKAGNKFVAYLDNRGYFKVYFEGIAATLETFKIGNYFATDNLLIYTIQNELYVFDNGVRKKLSSYTGFYAVGDSIAAFFDKTSKYLNVYYRGNIIPLADAMMGGSAKSLRVGDNLVAFIGQDDYLNIFFNGKIYSEQYKPLTFNVGMNVVAYIDASSSEFRIFYQGKTYEIETFMPESYKPGYDLVAFVNQTHSFKIFYKGDVITVSSFAPDFYKSADNLVVYGEIGFFKVFFEGEIYTLENYIPSLYLINKNTLAYIDQFDNLQCFYRGVMHTLSKEKVSDITLAGNTVSFKTGINTNKVFCNGKLY